MVAVIATLIIATPEIAQQSGNAAPTPTKLEDYVSSTASGDAAYSKGDYATALRLYRQLADQGNVSAQYVIGTMYFDGRGVPQVYATAALWFRKAAERGILPPRWISAACTPMAGASRRTSCWRING